jgi:RNA binding exosome subunit
MGDAAHSSLKSKGHSHRGKDDEGEFYIVFDGEKFYEDDFEIADHNDMGKIPRVEDGKLIIANPAWGS